jgi:hypothetical protein
VIQEAGGPEVLKLEELPDPEPGQGQVLVRAEAAAVNHFDLTQRRDPAATALLTSMVRRRPWVRVPERASRKTQQISDSLLLTSTTARCIEGAPLSIEFAGLADPLSPKRGSALP